jgi:ABC-type transport system substrate-binding protein
MGVNFMRAQQPAVRLLILLPLLAALTAMSRGGANGGTLPKTPTATAPTAPASVEKLTVAVDAWGFGELNPVQNRGSTFLRDYYLSLLLERDETGTIVPMLITEWKGGPEGWGLTLNPDARWQDGSPVTAEDVKFTFEAGAGDNTNPKFEKYPQFKGAWAASRIRETVDEVQVTDPHRVFIKTKKPDPLFLWAFSGIGFHIFYTGPKDYLLKVGHEGYLANPLGNGPYKVKEFKPQDRIVLERWEDFWGTYPYFKKPQARVMEVILNTDDAARFALLKSRQADVVVNIPYITAKNIPRERGKGPLWLHVLPGTGNQFIGFIPLMAAQEGTATEADLKSPLMDIRVREALELAIDRKAISEVAHAGFTTPTGSIYFYKAIGWRPEVGERISPYDPARAKQLLNEAGYPNGFEAHIPYTVFSNSPGIKEWLDAVAVYWADIGVKTTYAYHPPGDFGPRARKPAREWRPLQFQTMGRQEHAAITVDAFFREHCTSGVCFYTPKSNELALQLLETFDEAEMLRLLAAMEDEILKNKLVLPTYNAATVIGYTDRVLSHPFPPGAAHWMQLYRITLRD